MSGNELSRVRTEFRLRPPEPINQSLLESRKPTLLCNQVKSLQSCPDCPQTTRSGQADRPISEHAESITCGPGRSGVSGQPRVQWIYDTSISFLERNNFRFARDTPAMVRKGNWVSHFPQRDPSEVRHFHLSSCRCVNQASARKLVYASELADLPKQSND
jgi:hypothetical protein